MTAIVAHLFTHKPNFLTFGTDDSSSKSRHYPLKINRIWHYCTIIFFEFDWIWRKQ